MNATTLLADMALERLDRLHSISKTMTRKESFEQIMKNYRDFEKASEDNKDATMEMLRRFKGMDFDKSDICAHLNTIDVGDAEHSVIYCTDCERNLNEL